MTLLIDLTITPGGRRVRLESSAPVLALTGPSGVGKSTVLRALAGVEPRAVGQLRFDGERWLDGAVSVPAWRRRVGWVPQEATLFPHRTVRENLLWSGTDARCADWLEIAHLLDRMPRNLSGGERQRVALGRAWASGPRLLLLDEPFAALDRPLRDRLAPVLREKAAEAGIRVVLATHDAADLALLGAEPWSIDGTNS